MLILPFVNIHQNNSKAGDQQNNFCTVMPERFETFFFLISKNVIYTNGYFMHEKHRAHLENTRKKK